MNYDDRIVCKNITLRNQTISSAKTLILESVGGNITIGPNVTVQTGATLEIRGSFLVSDFSNFKVMEDAIFIVK